MSYCQSGITFISLLCKSTYILYLLKVISYFDIVYKNYLPTQKASPGTVYLMLWNTSKGWCMGKDIFTAESKLSYRNSSEHRIAWLYITSFRTCKQKLQRAMYIKPFKLPYPLYFIIIFLFFSVQCLCHLPENVF